MPSHCRHYDSYSHGTLSLDTASGVSPVISPKWTPDTLMDRKRMLGGHTAHTAES